jgi:hypothetical protein
MEQLKKLTIDEVRLWEFKGVTPARREHYYNKDLDVCAYISLNSRLDFWYDRKNNYSDCASSFNKFL